MVPRGATGLGCTMARLMSIRKRDTAYSKSVPLQGTTLTFTLAAFASSSSSVLSSSSSVLICFSPPSSVLLIQLWSPLINVSQVLSHPFSLPSPGSSFPTWRASALSTVVSGRHCAAVSLLRRTTPSAGMGRRWQTGKCVFWFVWTHSWQTHPLAHPAACSRCLLRFIGLLNDRFYKQLALIPEFPALQQHV